MGIVQLLNKFVVQNEPNKYPVLLLSNTLFGLNNIGQRATLWVSQATHRFGCPTTRRSDPSPGLLLRVLSLHKMEMKYVANKKN